MVGGGCWPLLLVLAVLAPTGVQACGRGSIYILDNGYRGMLVAISESVPEDVQLIQSIKDAFTEASSFLYRATGARAYFHDITILVPKTWSPRPEYERVTDETVEKSDILVDFPDPAQGQGDRPFVIKTTPCGQLGYYMHLTPDYLLDAGVASQFGAYGKTLVHEWGHLRYGVYDEYPGDNEPHFYAASDGSTKPTACSTKMAGVAVDGVTGALGCSAGPNGLVDPNCRFKDDEGNLPDTYGSIMYKQYLDHISYFCDSANDTHEHQQHNREAPTKQNQMCNGQSVWEVMRAHGDFNGINPPEDVSSTVPEFRVLQDGSKRYVLVLDVSGSMKGVRIAKLNQGCSNFVLANVRDGEEVGIVQFSNTASKLLDMTEVNNNTRDDIAAKIPTKANGGTSIGAGVRLGLTVLKNGGGTAGATMIVVSDGDENTSPLIKDVLNEVKAANITVHTIGITNLAALTMEQLADLTGGLSYLYSESDTSNAINDAFRDIAELGYSVFQQKNTITSNAQAMPAAARIEEPAVIDSTLGRDTEFTFDYTVANGITASVKSPSGVIYDATSPECVNRADYLVFRCTLPGVAEPGQWTYVVTNNQQSGQQKVAVSVTSKPLTDTTYPLLVKASWALREVDLSQKEVQRLYVSVSKGYIAVLNAKVIATVEQPTGSTTVDLQLHDNGAGADLTKNDGVYSAYFKEFNGNRRYSVKVKVQNDNETVISPGHVVGNGAASRFTGNPPDPDSPSGDFQREATGGSFILDGYSAAAMRDLYPPAQILDLKVEDVDIAAVEATVGFTATGSQLDVGTASSYDILYSKNSTLLRSETGYELVTADMMVGAADSSNLTDPRVAGQTETFRIRFPEGGDVTYFLGVKAHGDPGSDSISVLSNIVSVTMAPISLVSDANDTLTVGLVVGIIIYLLLVAVILFIALMWQCCGAAVPQSAEGDRPKQPSGGQSSTTKHWEVNTTTYYRSGNRPIEIQDTKTTTTTSTTTNEGTTSRTTTKATHKTATGHHNDGFESVKM